MPDTMEGKTKMHTLWKAECVGVSSHGPDAAEVYEIMEGHRRVAEYVTAEHAARIVQAVNAHDELVEALDRLVGEVRACWGMSEASLRQELGNTNYQVVADRITAALVALARAGGGTT